MQRWVLTVNVCSLCVCLKNLQDDSMMDRIKQHLLWLKNPTEGIAVKAKHSRYSVVLCSGAQSPNVVTAPLVCQHCGSSHSQIWVVGGHSYWPHWQQPTADILKNNRQWCSIVTTTLARIIAELIVILRHTHLAALLKCTVSYCRSSGKALPGAGINHSRIEG